MSTEYTIASNDETCYNRIYSYFEQSNTETAVIMVTGLTTNCCIKVLKTGDYLMVNNVKTHTHTLIHTAGRYATAVFLSEIDWGN